MSCEFLHCPDEGFGVIRTIDGSKWRLCPRHDKFVEKNGWTIEIENGREYVFSPVMIRGK